MKKLKLFLSLDYKTKRLLFEVYLNLGWARILKALPFSKVAPSLGEYMSETAYTSDDHTVVLKQISSAIKIMSKYTFWESQCLVKAMAAMNMLKRRNIENTLYLGTGKDENGKLIAHAWLRSGSVYLTGSEGMERFTIVGTFAHISDK
jgi:Transglutaminase-like superfamily